MKRSITFSIFLFLTTFAFGQRNAQYEHPEFQSIAAGHATVAILPINVALDFRPAVNARMSDEAFEQLKIDFSYSSQFELESYFLNRKGRKGFETRIQDVAKTNQLLEENGIDFYNIIEYTGEELSQLLGVDAVIMGHLSATQPTSEELAATVEILTDIALNTHANILNLKLVDSQGEVLWKFRRRFANGLGSDIFSTSIPLFRKAARRLPYGRK